MEEDPIASGTTRMLLPAGPAARAQWKHRRFADILAIKDVRGEEAQNPSSSWSRRRGRVRVAWDVRIFHPFWMKDRSKAVIVLEASTL
jgi:hypothetical protein